MAMCSMDYSTYPVHGWAERRVEKPVYVGGKYQLMNVTC